jgi:hypothetical protein
MPSRLVLALLVALACASVPNYDRNSGGVRNLGYFFNRNVPYETEERRHGRSAQTTGSWSPIRVDIRNVALGSLNSTMLTYLTGQLLPGVLNVLADSLRVVPVSGPLLHARFCSMAFTEANTCRQEGANTCGLNDDGSSYAVPDALLGSLTTCASCLTDGSCSGCQTTAAGAGVTDRDVVIFVRAVEAAACGGGNAPGADSTLAFAATCQRDQNDRPIFGCVRGARHAPPRTCTGKARPHHMMCAAARHLHTA